MKSTIIFNFNRVTLVFEHVSLMDSLQQQNLMGAVYAEELELQILNEQYYSYLQITVDITFKQQAMISIFLTTEFNDYLSFLPDGQKYNYHSLKFISHIKKIRVL